MLEQITTTKRTELKFVEPINCRMEIREDREGLHLFVNFEASFGNGSGGFDYGAKELGLTITLGKTGSRVETYTAGRGKFDIAMSTEFEEGFHKFVEIACRAANIPVSRNDAYNIRRRAESEGFK